MAAVAKSNIKLIKLLLANDADPNLTATKEAPLHVAVNLGCFGCVTALVEAGVNLERSNGGARRSHTDPSRQVPRIQ